MSESKEKRLRALEYQRDGLSRALIESNKTHVHLLDEIEELKTAQSEDKLRIIRERNEARAENRKAAKAVKSWRAMTYAALLLAISMMVLTIMAVQDVPTAQAADPAAEVEVQVVDRMEAE